MLNFIMVSISLFLLVLTGWTLTTYLVKQDSQELIQEEIKNLFDICKKFFISLKNLIAILAANPVANDSIEEDSTKTSLLDKNEQSLRLVQPVKEVEASTLERTQQEDDDTALSSFSPEVIEVINEEEERIA